ncbi:tRNA lysidine(34) synthetase TilS [Desulfuromonas acetoxidans]|uniref:tRNA lysidine(34) synthetase TilS n=1 Tax=Desulfuromonas acetoxidans TaxID=891 RepID=UPI0015948813|nr:tRNA lysidine(34) synthetase TilS [Desulfuromonas acetoxidans]MBF0644003.1 tRNA lysidine(34) synthetase TilS [Desulfuromonas acetoxidans]NVD23241.1 tRNA lysidine(34) synthetase TilS [Desulfuromonas acetoxidans]NVE15518.1 tRNA lysidine(34) synthetase TilS [Desulfuromonas acetoxidans]
MPYSLVEKIADTIAQHQLIASGATVVIGVSGGADSVCLLHVLVELAGQHHFDVVVAHLDHGLRDESADDALFVQELAARLDLRFFKRRVEVGGLAQRNRWGLEEAGREARRAFLSEVADQVGGAVIALAHHRDDQSETVLMHLARGCGVGGLAGMRWQEGKYIRPMLSICRNEINAFLQRHRLEWREDDSNRNERFKRNLIRHQVLPALTRYNQQTVRHIAELAEKVAVEEAYWQQQLDDWLGHHACEQQGQWQVACLALCDCHPALRHRLLRELLARVRGTTRGLGGGHVFELDRQLFSPAPQWQMDLPCCWAARRYDHLVFRREAPVPAATVDMVINGPGRYRVDGQRTLLVKRGTSDSCEAPAVWFSDQQIDFPLRLRSFQPGDRIQMADSAGHKKLKALFAEHRWTNEARQRALVLECRGEILWVPELRQRCCLPISRDTKSGFVLHVLKAKDKI